MLATVAKQRIYTPSGPIAAQFHASPAFFRGLRGPIGSGKTVACCYELWNMAMQQQPSPVDGWRRTRWAVVRQTYRQLETSTMRTWQAQFPERIFGKMKMSPPFRHIITNEAQRFQMEVWFLALEDESNVRDLLSTEWSGFFLNEAREFPKGLVDNIISRARRYPEMEHGGPTRPGIVADTNAPAEDHWWPILAGDTPCPEHWPPEQVALYVKPDGWEFFSQPAAVLEIRRGTMVVGYEVNPKAENLHNLHPDYYSQQTQGKEKDWIDVYLRNIYKTIKAGKPVYPEYAQDTHLSKVPIKPNKLLKSFIGADFGLTPAAVLIQRVPTGQYQIVREWVSMDLTIPLFAEWVVRELGELGYGPEDYEGWGDPAGDQRDQKGDTAFAICRAQGLHLSPAPTNDPSIRVGAVSGLLTRMIAGKPAMVVSSNCSYIHNGFLHGYHYRRYRLHAEKYEEKPDKNIYSHIHDALQYAALGAGEGRKLLGARAADVVTLSRTERRYVPGGSHRPGRRWNRK